MPKQHRLGRGERVPQVPPHGRRPLGRAVADAPRRHRHRVDRHHDRRRSTRPRTSTGCRRTTRSRPTPSGTASAAKAALDFIQSCGDEPDGGRLRRGRTFPRRSAAATTGGKLRNPVTLADDALAKQATTILGMNKNAPTQVCAECHAPNQTDAARLAGEDRRRRSATCLKDADAAARSRQRHAARTSRVDNDEFKIVRPVRGRRRRALRGAASTGTGDADLYVKRGEEPTQDVYDCRPFAQSSTEKCDKAQFNATGPAKFYVGLNGYAGRHGQGHGRSTPSPARTRCRRRIASTASASSRATPTRRSPRASSASTRPARTSAGSRTRSRRRSPPARRQHRRHVGARVRQVQEPRVDAEGQPPAPDAGASSTSSPSGSRAACRG